jgi:hypothetical protein
VHVLSFEHIIDHSCVYEVCSSSAGIQRPLEGTRTIQLTQPIGSTKSYNIDHFGNNQFQYFDRKVKKLHGGLPSGKARKDLKSVVAVAVQLYACGSCNVIGVVFIQRPRPQVLYRVREVLAPLPQPHIFSYILDSATN